MSDYADEKTGTEKAKYKIYKHFQISKWKKILCITFSEI